MNALRKKAAVKKMNDLIDKGLSLQEALQELRFDDAKYSEEELDLLSVSNMTAEVPGPAPTYDPKNPNALLDLSKFDYKNLTGDSFKEYVQLVGDRSYREVDKETGEEKPIVGQLKAEDLYDFQVHKVDVVMKARYPGVVGTPSDFNGIKIKADKPEQFTRIPVKMAIELNAQILNGHSRAGHGKYYLLKK